MASNRYRSYVQRLFLRYTVAIIIFLCGLVLAFLAINNKWLTEAESLRSSTMLAGALEQEVAQYKEGLAALANDAHILAVCEQQTTERLANANRLLYGFVNAREIRGLFVRVDAEGELADARERLDRIEEEKGQITHRLQEESKRMATQMLENARQAANNAELDVRRRIASEEAHAAADVRAEVIARAAKLARERLSVALSEEDDYRLRQETLRGLL